VFAVSHLLDCAVIRSASAGRNSLAVDSGMGDAS
jgi:hypothetical protein